jgi:hypothetical protein
MRWLPVFVALVGCARAEIGGGGGDGGGSGVDSGGGGNDGNNQNDATPSDSSVPIDAAVMKTLTQNTSTAVTATQIGCQQTNPATSYTKENSYYRVFPLADHQITTAFHITGVTFAIERATGTGTQPATVKLGTYTGTIGANTLDLTKVTALGSASIQIANNATSMTVPVSMFTPATITAPANSNVIAELLIPDGVATQRIFYIGSNNGGQTRPSYIRAPDCGVTAPTSYAVAPVSQPTVQIVLSVTGTH